MAQEYKNKGPIYITTEKYETMRQAGTLENGREYKITDWEAQEKLIPGSNITIASDGKTISAQVPTANVDDVQINGTTIVTDKIANIPNSSSTVSGVMTSTQFSKLEGIEEGAQKNAANTVIDANYVHTDNNYTTVEKTKLEGIKEGANVVNVSATGTSTNDVRYITIDGTESRFASVALRAMKTDWKGSITTAAAASAILSDSSTAEGDGYLGTVQWTDLPGDMDQAEVKAFVIKKSDSQSIVQFECTSSIVSPCAWFYNSHAAEWKSYVPVINNVTTTTTTEALSANMGKELQDQISNLKNIGRFLAIWNCATGLPLTDPTTLPYTYKTGDYYRVGTVAGSYTHTVSMSGIDEENESFNVQFSFTDSTSTSYTTVADLSDALHAQGHTAHSGTCPATGSATGEGGTWTIGYVASDSGTNILLQDSETSARGTILDSATGITLNDTVTGSTTNYKPNGATYTGAASTTVETEDVEIGWVYYYDGTNWLAQSAGGGGLVQDVQVDGASVLSAETGVANIPLASASVSGVMTSAQYTKLDGIETGAQVNTVTSVDGATGTVALSDVKYTSQSLTSSQQSIARTNIGAIALEEYDSTATPEDNVLYYVIES